MKLTDARQAELKAKFDGVPDRDLIQELLRRERLQIVDANALYWPEMKECGGYYNSIRKIVLHLLGKSLDDKNLIHFIDEPDMIGHQSLLGASVIVLAPKKREEVRPQVYDQFGPAAP